MRYEHLKTLLEKIPLDKLLLCSDAPYFTPKNIIDAHIRESKNEPSNLCNVLQACAQILKMTTKQLAQIVRKNSVEFFNFYKQIETDEPPTQPEPEPAGATTTREKKTDEKLKNNKTSKNEGNKNKSNPEKEEAEIGSEDSDDNLPTKPKSRSKPSAKTTKSKSKGADSSEDDEVPAAKSQSKAKSKSKAKSREADSSESDEVVGLATSKSNSKSKSKPNPKLKEESSESDEVPTAKSKSKSKSKKKPAKTEQAQPQQKSIDPTPKIDPKVEIKLASILESDESESSLSEGDVRNLGELSLEPYNSDEELLNLEYACKMCRTKLFNTENLLDHSKQMNVLGKRCRMFFIERMEWAKFEQEGELQESRLLCPKCDTKLGRYDPKGIQCSCGEMVGTYKVVRSRVDVVGVSGVVNESESDDDGAILGKTQGKKSKKKSTVVKKSTKGNFSSWRNKAT